ncbi:DNA fragmentation factor subunit beta-like isoform X2 [Daphnia carinata]|uniref:DNA fragmentation factor subunit beta-like isoform X2 n=1 Tax=Daphnia carinata TaxID=120202 RepID=UPI00257F5A06|nr:DNA fragmentation factor subunit beta-like isoform X2 [Daphnia carinata]
MEIMKKMGCMKPKKLPVKVTDEKRSRKVGLVVTSLIDLKKKSHDVFKVPADSHNLDSLFVVLEDGTEVSHDAYLFSLVNNTLLIIYHKKPAVPINSSSLQQTMERYLSALHDLQKFNSEEVVKFIEDNKDDKLKLTWQYVTTLTSTKSHFSSISDHPEWFTGCNKLVTTKEEYFRKCAQGRIRSYLRDARNRLSHNKLSLSPIEKLKSCLEEKKYFACYFDRKDRSQDRLCDSKGEFHCQGQYNKPICQNNHWINPYDNAESRILFSTWNLDHVIERVKILTALCSQIRCNNGCDHLKYFDLLFSRKNLKLVHKNCHVIGPHIECQIV